MLTDSEARARMADSAYNAYLTHWTESAVVPRYLDLVRRVAEEKQDARLVLAFSDEDPGT